MGITPHPALSPWERESRKPLLRRPLSPLGEGQGRGNARFADR